MSILQCSLSQVYKQIAINVHNFIFAKRDIPELRYISFYIYEEKWALPFADSDKNLYCVTHVPTERFITFGDGIKKVLVLANAITQAKNGVLFIDEVETAIHKKYYDEIFRFIVKACSAFNVQTFITTHSIEAVDGLLATQDYQEQTVVDDISVITIKKANGQTYSRILTGREVAADREAFGFEVRL